MKLIDMKGCTCGHRRYCHKVDGAGACFLIGCKCKRFKAVKTKNKEEIRKKLEPKTVD